MQSMRSTDWVAAEMADWFDSEMEDMAFRFELETNGRERTVSHGTEACCQKSFRI